MIWGWGPQINRPIRRALANNSAATTLLCEAPVRVEPQCNEQGPVLPRTGGRGPVVRGWAGPFITLGVRPAPGATHKSALKPVLSSPRSAEHCRRAHACAHEGSRHEGRAQAKPASKFPARKLQGAPPMAKSSAYKRNRAKFLHIINPKGRFPENTARNKHPANRFSSDYFPHKTSSLQTFSIFM